MNWLERTDIVMWKNIGGIWVPDEPPRNEDQRRFTRNILRGGTRALNTVAAFIPTIIRTYVFERRFRIMLLAGCVAVLLGAGLYVRHDLRIEARQVLIEVLPAPGGMRLYNGHFVARKEGEKEIVEFFFSFRNAGAGQRFTVSMANGLHVLEYELANAAFRGEYFAKRYRTRYLNYEVRENGDCGGVLTLSGPVLASEVREVQLSVYLISRPEPQSMQLSLQGLSSVDLDAVSPAPTLRTDYAVHYEALPESVTKGSEPIFLRLHDRERGYRLEHRIFLLGVVLGVLGSLIASILYDFLRDLEAKTGRYRSSGVSSGKKSVQLR